MPPIIHLTTSPERDAASVDSVFVEQSIAADIISNNNIEEPFADLPSIYHQGLIQAYDTAYLGAEATAATFASEVRATGPVTIYVDLGTGSGLTARECCRVLCAAGYRFDIALADAITGFGYMAIGKVQSVNTPPGAVLGVQFIYGNLAGQQTLVRRCLLASFQVSVASIITAQRILVSFKKNVRGTQLRHWAALLAPGGRLIVDIPHPRRLPGSLTLSTVPATCRVIAKPSAWEDCREYAKELAAKAGLVIVNDMPAQLPRDHQEDGIPDLSRWITSIKARTLTQPITPIMLEWFGKRYTQAARDHYTAQNISCSHDIAAVVAVFQLAPAAESPTDQPHTKYVIDETLTGDARRKAIKAPAKKERKAGKASKHKGDGDGGAGNSGAVA